MTDKKLLQTLTKIGLSEKEAQVYYSALQLGPSTVMQISKAASIKRTTSYSIIESLKQKGLIKEVVIGIKELLEAESPEHLQQLLQKQQTELDSILPQLSALFKIKGEESVVKYYEGIEQVKKVYLDLLSSVKINEDYFVLSNMDDWRRHDPKFFDGFLEKRGRLDINVKMIIVDSKLSRERASTTRQPNEEFRFLPKDTSLSTNLVIIPSKVVIQQLEGIPMAMVIENKHIVRMHREMYQLIWKSLKAE